MLWYIYVIIWTVNTNILERLKPNLYTMQSANCLFEISKQWRNVFPYKYISNWIYSSIVYNSTSLCNYVLYQGQLDPRVFPNRHHPINSKLIRTRASNFSVSSWLMNIRTRNLCTQYSIVFMHASVTINIHSNLPI